MTWDTNQLTIAEAEALFAEPLPEELEPGEDVFCERELIEVYRRVTADMVAALEKIKQRLDAVLDEFPFNPRPEPLEATRHTARTAIALAKP